MATANEIKIGHIAVGELPDRLGVASELQELQARVRTWIEMASPEMQPLLRWQLLSRPKYFRPLTIFACCHAIEKRPDRSQVIASAVALEIFHNVSLVIDDILDGSRFRRDRLTLHCRFGFLPGLMAGGYLTAGGFAYVKDDPYTVALLAELMQRLGVAECVQWRLRRHALGVEDWRMIASEDTGVMFETCARLAIRDDRLRKFGMLLGLLYHGCDDVGDVRGAVALGGGGEKDLLDGILTLPAAFAIRDPQVAALFRRAGKDSYKRLMKALSAALPQAEAYLDQLAKDAKQEAIQNSDAPEKLLALVDFTRALSNS